MAQYVTTQKTEKQKQVQMLTEPRWLISST